MDMIFCNNETPINNKFKYSVIRTIRMMFTCALLLTIVSCDNLEKIKRIGKAPALASVDVPVLPDEQLEAEDAYVIEKARRQRERMRKTNSLWQPDSTTFFRDSRNWRVGDIVNVIISIQDTAKLANQTTQARTNANTMSLNKFFTKEDAIAATIGVKRNAAGVRPLGTLLDAGADSGHAGSGGIARSENIQTTIAAIVTKVLPNGNLVVQGHQEVRVNHELREVKVAGIIRAKDITSVNSILSSQIAEARISYGGRGVVSDVQQPKYGHQLVDAISPF